MKCLELLFNMFFVLGGKSIPRGESSSRGPQYDVDLPCAGADAYVAPSPGKGSIPVCV